MDDDQVEIMKNVRTRDRARQDGFADIIFEQAKTHQECFIAGIHAANENSPSARKLARLISEAECANLLLENVLAEDMESCGALTLARGILNCAIAEARKP